VRSTDKLSAEELSQPKAKLFSALDRESGVRSFLAFDMDKICSATLIFPKPDNITE
jgi:hypothetical protein